MRGAVLGWIVGFSLAGGVLAQSPAPLDLRFTLDIDGRFIGEPRLVLALGTPSQVTVADDRGNGYRLDVRADEPEAPTEPASVVVTTSLYARVHGVWHLIGEPMLQVALDGRPASVSVDALGSNVPHYGIAVSARAATLDGDGSPASP